MAVARRQQQRDGASGTGQLGATTGASGTGQLGATTGASSTWQLGGNNRAGDRVDADTPAPTSRVKAGGGKTAASTVACATFLSQISGGSTSIEVASCAQCAVAGTGGDEVADASRMEENGINGASIDITTRTAEVGLVAPRLREPLRARFTQLAAAGLQHQQPAAASSQQHQRQPAASSSWRQPRERK